MPTKSLLLFILLVTWYVAGIAQPSFTNKEIELLLREVQKNKTDTNHAASLLKLSKYYIFKPGENKTDIDSALLFIQRAEKLSTALSYHAGICNCLYQYSIAYREGGDRIKGKQYALNAIDVCTQYKFPDLLGESYMELTQYLDYRKADENNERIKLFKKADSVFSISGNKERQAFALKNLGDEYQLSQQLSPAIQALKQSLALYKTIGYTKIHGIYDLLGNCYMRLTDYHSALTYGLLAEEVASSNNDTSLQLCTIYNRIGLIYSSLGQQTNALGYFLKSHEVARKYNDLFSIYVVTCRVVKTYSSLHQGNEAISFLKKVSNQYAVPADLGITIDDLYLATYTGLKDYKSAQKYCDRIISSPGYKDYITAITSVAEFYIATNQWQKATAALSLHAAYINNNPDRKAVTQQKHYLLQSRVDSLRGNYLSALKHYQKYKELNDSILNVNKNNVIEHLQVEFETAKKDQQLTLKEKSIALLTNQSELQYQQLTKSKLIRNVTIAAISILAVFLGLLYSRYQLKQKANMEINDKNLALQQMVNEKEWLLKEVHHRVKNNLQTVVSLLESQSAYLQSDALLAIQDSQNRVHAMSLVHQKLYQAENITSINMAVYLPELVNYLRESFSASQIHFNLQVARVELDVSQAIPVGLIVNEAITNAIKYAFTPDRSNKQITIMMKQLNNKLVKLTVSDNGIGLPAGFNMNRNGGLGLKLMQGLTEDIEGRFEIITENETTISVSFTPNILLHKATVSLHSKLISHPA